MKNLIKTISLITLMCLSMFGFSQTVVLSTDTSIGLTCLHCAQDTVKLTVNIGDTINITNQATSSSYFNVDTNNVTASTNFTSYEFDTMYVYKINKDSKSVIIFAGSDNVDNLTVTFKVLIDTNTTGIDEITYNKINATIFPNPTKDNFTVKSDTKISKIDVISETGQVVETENFGNSGLTEYEMNVSNIPNGIYFVRINDISTQKLIINK